jgi:hypothetical protein
MSVNFDPQSQSYPIAHYSLRYLILVHFNALAFHVLCKLISSLTDEHIECQYDSWETFSFLNCPDESISVSDIVHLKIRIPDTFFSDYKFVGFMVHVWYATTSSTVLLQLLT